MMWCWGRSGGVCWSSANGSMTVREGEEVPFFHHLISSCGCGGCIKHFLALFECMRLRMGLDGGVASHDGCSVVFARVSSNILSESVPLTNSDKSRRSGGAYASLGTRQEGGRFEDIGLSLCASPLRILVLGLQRTEF